jgi:hypothetical protein
MPSRDGCNGEFSAQCEDASSDAWAKGESDGSESFQHHSLKECHLAMTHAYVPYKAQKRPWNESHVSKDEI